MEMMYEDIAENPIFEKDIIPGQVFETIFDDGKGGQFFHQLSNHDFLLRLSAHHLYSAIKTGIGDISQIPILAIIGISFAAG
jgi:hypothetical protein